MSRLFSKCTDVLLALLVFFLPIEHKYDKVFRHLSAKLIPEGFVFPRSFDKKIYFYASDIAALLLLLFALFAFRVPLRRLLTEKGTLFLWIVFGCALASICASPFSHYPVLYTRLLQLLTPILLFSFLANAPFSEKRTNLLLSSFIAAALLQSSIAIAQYFYQSPLGLHLLSEPHRVTGTFPTSNGYRWILDRLFDYAPPSLDIMRASGTFSHCNVLGGFLALSLIACYPLIASTSKNWLRRLLGLTLIVLFFGMSITYSRSALFGWALGTIVWFGLTIYHRGLARLFTDRSIRFLVLVIAASVAISGVLLFDQCANRGGIVNYNTIAQGSDQVRIDSQNIALKIIEENPLLGVGYQQFSRGAAPFLPPGVRPQGTHNIYFFLASETGLISLAAFLCFIAWTLLSAIRSPYNPLLATFLAAFIAFLFIGGCDYYPILFHQGKLMLFITAGLLASHSLRSKQPQALPS